MEILRRINASKYVTELYCKYNDFAKCVQLHPNLSFADLWEMEGAQKFKGKRLAKDIYKAFHFNEFNELYNSLYYLLLYLVYADNLKSCPIPPKSLLEYEGWN